MSPSPLAGRRRSPDAGGYPRGEETRRKIIEAALRVFGEEGYERASTRQIAAAAGVVPPAVQYYFDSKEGLHRACAEFIIDRSALVLAPPRQRAADAVSSGDRQAVWDALFNLLDTMADFALTSSEALGWSRFMARGQTDGAGPAFPLIRDGLVQPLQRTCAELVGMLIGRPADDQTTLLRSCAVMSQLSYFHLHKGSALALMGWARYGPAEIAAIKQVLRTHARGSLSLDLGPAG